MASFLGVYINVPHQISRIHKQTNKTYRRRINFNFYDYNINMNSQVKMIG